MKKLSDYVYKNITTISFGFIMKFIGTISELFIPWLLAYLIDKIVPMNNVTYIVLIGALMIVLALMAFIFNVIANRSAAKSANNITREIRYELFKKTVYLSCKQIDEYTTPSVISRLTSNSYDVNRMLGMIQRLGVRAPILLIGGIIMTLLLDPILTLVLVSTLPLIVLIVYLVSKKGVPLFTKSYTSGDKLVRTVRENVTGIRVIKALSKTNYEKTRFNTVNEELSSKEQKANVTMSLSNPLMNLVFNIGLVAVLLAGAYRVASGATDPGNIVAFLTYFTLILNALISLTRIFIMYSKAMASNKRIFEVINTKDDLVILKEDKIVTDQHIIFDDVSFSYLKQKDNISNLSFTLKKGQTLGIIGDVGSGKTTIINLLMRFYDADKGVIRINGENVNSIAFDKLYSMFGVAFQNDILFADTIYNNIDFYKNDNLDEIKNAAAFAQASSFITGFEDDFEHKIARKGLDLSGGQKQRLLIARALSKKAEIIILDDSSSALDYKTDAILRKHINTEFNKCTKIIVAQRISSIKHADLIIVLENGVMVGRGTHEELIETCHPYNDIYQLQMGDKI